MLLKLQTICRTHKNENQYSIYIYLGTSTVVIKG